MRSIDLLLEYPLGLMVGTFSVAILELIVYLACFELLTSYHCWEEIKKGNMAVALATGGKIFGICNILSSAAAGSNIYDFMIWSSIGTLLLFIVHLLFELLTPVFRINSEVAADNRAVGLIAMFISVSSSLIISACITFD